MTHLEKIKSRGYWEIVIRPCAFAKHRVPNAIDLREIASTRKVQIRGWDFPHYGPEEAKLAEDHIECEVDFLHHVEAWRIYQSGLFVYMGGMRADWDDQNRTISGKPRWVQQPGNVLYVADTVWLLTEALEFASRLALSDIGAEQMHVSAIAHSLGGRRLHLELSDRHLSDIYRVPDDVSMLKQSGVFSRNQLLAEKASLAVDWSRYFFRQFGWRDASPEILAEVQSQSRR